MVQKVSFLRLHPRQWIIKKKSNQLDLNKSNTLPETNSKLAPISEAHTPKFGKERIIFQASIFTQVLLLAG